MLLSEALNNLRTFFTPVRISRNLVVILFLTLLQNIVAPVLAPNLTSPKANAAAMYDNRSTWLHWTSWTPANSSVAYSGANHTPYAGELGSAITSNSQQINLTTQGNGQTGYLWDTTQYSFSNDFSVSAQVYLGARDGADGLSFMMRPLSGWPNGGTSSGSGASHARTGNSQIRIEIDTYQNGTEIANDHLSIYSRNSSGVETKYGGNGVALKDANCNAVTDLENNTYPYFSLQWIAQSRTLKFFAGEEANCLIYSTVISSSEQDASTFTFGFQAETGGANNYQSAGKINYQSREIPASSELDSALTLNGTSQYAVSENDGTGSIYDLGATYSAEAWIKPTSRCESSVCEIFGKEYSYLFAAYTNRVYFAIGNGSAWYYNGWVNAEGYIPTGSWTHFAVTYTGTTFKIYLNGKITYQHDTLVPPLANDERFTVGARTLKDNSAWLYDYFGGSIDEVRIWNTARTEAQILSDMHSRPSLSDANLLSYFDFNEGSGSRLINRVENSVPNTDLVIKNSPSWSDVKITSQPNYNAYTTITFPRTYLLANGGWKVPEGVTKIAAVIVAGGGGGNAETDGVGWVSGGGGAGGYLYTTLSGLNRDVLTVKVGQGGRSGYYAPNHSANRKPTNGQDSTLQSTVAVGGGYGGGMSYYGNANGGSGGSGGGGGTYNGVGGAGTAGQGNAGGSSDGTCCVSGGGGGAGGAGGSRSLSPARGGAAGDGVLNPMYISGTSTEYLAAGGAGGSWYGSAGLAGTKGGTAYGSHATMNTGSGGGGGGGPSPYYSGYGGSGIVIVRWITASAPTFTALSSVDTTTALTRYTFRSGGSATSPLTRNFQWQYSSDTGTTWSTVQASTSDSYTTGLLDLGTSGTRYKYRVIVTDSDTAGLSITDSSTSYLVINRYPTISPPTSNNSGLLVHLDASESASYSGSGSTWNDISGGGRNANLGITSGGPVVAGTSPATCSAPTFSQSNGGNFSFTGNVTAPRNCAWISGSTFSNVGETYTVEMWVKPAVANQAQYSALISTPWIAGDKINFTIAFDGTQTSGNPNIYGGVFDGATWFSTSGTPITLNSWSHVVLVAANRTLTLYVNGDSKTEKSLSSAPSGAGKGVLIGRRWDVNDTFNGSIGTVRISNQALTAEQIRQNYYLSSNRFSSSVFGIKSSSTSYATTLTETFTATNGTGTKRFTFTPNNRAGIVWDTATANSAVLRVTSDLNVGTYYETMTATDSATALTTLALTITVDKARQASLSIGQYNAYPGVSTYPVNVYGGSGSGAVTRTLTDAGTASCTLANSMFLSAVRPGTCTVRAVKEGGTNYYTETATATIYWIQWSDAYATRAPSTPTEIVLNHQTAITKYNFETLTVTSYQNSSGVTITTVATGATLRVIGDGFSPTAAYTEVVFASMDSIDLTSGLQVVSDGSGGYYLQLTVPSGVTSGAITVNSPKGTAVGPSLTITP